MFACESQAGDDTMLKTPLCDLFGIEVPIILAPMGTCTSAELAAAVSNEGGWEASDRSSEPPRHQVPHEHVENADTPTASISRTTEPPSLDPLENSIGGKSTCPATCRMAPVHRKPSFGCLD
jgi:hypothetical protein